MSEHFDLYCRTCAKSSRVFAVNHGGAQIAQVCLDLPLLSELGDILSALRSGLRLTNVVGCDQATAEIITPRLLEFARLHADHDVVARSEYGRLHECRPETDQEAVPHEGGIDPKESSQVTEWQDLGGEA